MPLEDVDKFKCIASKQDKSSPSSFFGLQYCLRPRWVVPTRRWCDRFWSTVAALGQYEKPTIGCWTSLAMAASATLYMRGADIVHQRQIYGSASASATPPHGTAKWIYTARTKKAPLVWGCNKTSRRWIDKRLSSVYSTRRTGGQLKTWAIKIKAYMEQLCG